MYKKFPIPILRLFAATVAAIAFSAASASVATAETVDTSACASPTLSQPFLSSNDANQYFLMPGQSQSGFNGEGWTLSGGAKVIPASEAGHQTEYVLDLPSGSKAISPTVCVTDEYPRARMVVRDAVGSEGVFFYVSYAGTDTWNNPKNTGQVHGAGTAATLSTPVNLQPAGTSGWQLVRFTLVPGGKTSDFQVDDFYVDPFRR